MEVYAIRMAMICSSSVCCEDSLMKKCGCVQIPMALKFFIYFGLYYTLPRDRIEEVDDTGEPINTSSTWHGFYVQEALLTHSIGCHTCKV